MNQMNSYHHYMEMPMSVLLEERDTVQQELKDLISKLKELKDIVHMKLYSYCPSDSEIEQMYNDYITGQASLAGLNQIEFISERCKRS